jgi:hypothetical protein
MMERDLAKISGIIQPALGLPAWDVKLGLGSFITMQFGSAIADRKGIKRGEWYLWIYCCGWFLEEAHEQFIGSEDPRELLQQRLTVLEGRILQDIQIAYPPFLTRFIFEGGITLHTFPLSFTDDNAYWKLFTPHRKVLSVGPAGNWAYEKSSLRGT